MPLLIGRHLILILQCSRDLMGSYGYRRTLGRWPDQACGRITITGLPVWRTTRSVTLPNSQRPNARSTMRAQATRLSEVFLARSTIAAAAPSAPPSINTEET